MTSTSRSAARGRAAEELERRAGRADALAPASPSAQEPLAFAAGLYRAQADLAAAIEGVPLAGALEADLERLAGELDGIMRYAAAKGPPGLSGDARARAGGGWAGLLEWWRGGRSGRDDYLSRALLRPYAGALAAAGVRPEPGGADAAGSRCPFCGAPPWIGWRRAEAGESGAQRFLGCGLCGGEWNVNRIRCAACEQEDPHKLAVFHSERYPAVRLEACEVCRRYVKSIDLTVDARAIPEVDDLLSLAMDLWASDQGYTRLEPSIAGI
ncbi:MAG TPA: formate dehydrogenase accessory protein FdhE [Kofleriaceae bacterium]|nr:formate dehydrogenase accessory protein FdhE [Kofleriaceae bacterium]